jgi:hypothetical protein
MRKSPVSAGVIEGVVVQMVGEHLVGMLHCFDIARWIELHAQAPARAHAP